MICVSLAEKTLEETLAALVGLPFAEIRMDAMEGLSRGDVDGLFSRHNRLIATCRPGRFTDDIRKTRLLAAIEAGAAYVDVELDAQDYTGRRSSQRQRHMGARSSFPFMITRGHRTGRTLEATLSACFRKGADIAKIACTIRSAGDTARLLGLLDDTRKIVAIGMGEKGRITRVVAPMMGSPFTFASLSEGRETAEGQIDKGRLEDLMKALGRGLSMEVGP